MDKYLKYIHAFHNGNKVEITFIETHLKKHLSIPENEEDQTGSNRDRTYPGLPTSQAKHGHIKGWLQGARPEGKQVVNETPTQSTEDRRWGTQ